MLGEGLQSTKFHFSMAIFLHDLMASIAVQYLLAEQMVVAHQSSCTINSKNFRQLYLTLLSLYHQRSSSPPHRASASGPCSGEGTRCPACGGANRLTEDDIQQHKLGMAEVHTCACGYGCSVEDKLLRRPLVNRGRSIFQLQLLLRPIHVDLFSNSSKS